MRVPILAILLLMALPVVGVHAVQPNEVLSDPE